MLFDLAGAAGLEEKRTKMGTGQHINATEDRAGSFFRLFSAITIEPSPGYFVATVMHIALRSPKDKKFIVDGEDVVPFVHAVLDKVS